jgi:hypothetical protein
MLLDEIKNLNRPMSKKEVCAALGRTGPTITKLLKAGKIIGGPPVRGGKAYIDPQSVAAFLTSGYQK